MLDKVPVHRAGDEIRWKKMRTCDKGWQEGEYWEKEKVKTARVETLKPQTKTARVRTAAEGQQRMTEAVMRMQQEVRVKEYRWAEEVSQRWKQLKGEDRTKMKKEARLLRCTLLNGSTWSTEKRYMRRYKGKCDIFFGIELRLRKEETEEQFNREAKEGWIFAADAARITDQRASSEDRKHTSGGVFVAVDSNLGAVVRADEGTVVSIPGIERRIAQAWVNVGGGLRFSRVYFWHSEGWTSRNEALAGSSCEASRSHQTPVVGSV